MNKTLKKKTKTKYIYRHVLIPIPKELIKRMRGI